MMYSGNSTYCYSNSLRMCLAQAGMERLPEVGFLECLTGMPFGAMFLQLESPLFFPSPATIDPDTGLTRALELLGWACETWRGDGSNEAEAELRDALAYGPVLIGPLDMGYLPYDPQHAFKRGGDHFVVALGLEGNFVRLHDPQLYPYAVLPLTDLLWSWDAQTFGYAESRYTLRYGFHESQQTTRKALFGTALTEAKNALRTFPDGPVAYGGAQAFRLAAALLRDVPNPVYTGMLSGFVMALGARRSLDGAAFMKEAGKSDASGLLLERAKLFGQGQYHAAEEDWAETARLLEKLGELEDQLTESVS